MGPNVIQYERAVNLYKVYIIDVVVSGGLTILILQKRLYRVVVYF